VPIPMEDHKRQLYGLLMACGSSFVLVLMASKWWARRVMSICA